MQRPLPPFRAKPAKIAPLPRAYMADQRTDPGLDAMLVTVKAPRKSVRFERPARPAKSKIAKLRVLGRNGAVPA